MYRTEVILIDNAGIKSEEEGMVSEFYTDDSYKAIKRKIYSDTEAIELGYDNGDDDSMTGLNGYPCNKGLIVTLNNTNQQPISEAPSLLTLGFAFSHPLLCNFFGAQLLSNVTVP